MGFIADKQTLDDLSLLDRYSSGSVFALFNQVVTKGGEILLEKMFRHPLTDATAINYRSGLFKYFQGQELEFPLDPRQFEVMENFLHSVEQQNWLSAFGQTLRRKSLRMIGLNEEYNLFMGGAKTTVDLLHQLNDFLEILLKKNPETPFKKQILEFREIVNDKRFEKLAAVKQHVRISFIQQLRCSHILGNVLYERLLGLLKMLYELDVYMAVSKVSRLRQFNYAAARPVDEQVLEIQNCRHPALKNAKGNNIGVDKNMNVLFVTGANMAGKSTLMKSVGVAVYLAHMGFPVAVDAMKFSVKDGIFSSINLPDDISQGYSHFYAEVLRVKAVAEEVGRSKHLLVIFDELFKGTNVKDAFDATLACTEAFAEYRNCLFIISTHIIEVGEQLRNHDNIQFNYLPTTMKGRTPQYTYHLTPGITNDRQGMMIIHNEGILDMLEETHDHDTFP